MATNLDPIFRFVARRCGEGAAEAVVAEVFEEAFLGWERYQPALGSMRQWLFGIANNVIRVHHRTEQRHYRSAAAGRYRSPLDSPAADAGAAERVDAATAWPAVAAALAELRESDREALLLFAWGPMTYAEVAQALEIPVGTVRSRIHRGRMSLRAQLIAAGLALDEGDLS